MTQSDWFWIPYELFLNLLQAVLYTWFLDRLLIKKRQEKISFWICVILIFLGYSLDLLAEKLTLKLAFSNIWVKSIPIVYCFIFYKDHWWIKLLWSVILLIVPTTLISFAYYTSAFITGLPYEMLLERGWPRLFFTFFGNLFLTTILLLLVRYFSSLKHNNFTNMFYVGFLLIINLGAYFTAEVMYALYPAGNVSNNLFFAISGCSLFICLSSLFLYRALCRYAEKESEAAYIEGQKAAADSRFEEISQMYSMMQLLNHDIRKHMQVTEEMLSRYEIEESREYLAEVAANLESLFSTGCLPLDSALTVRQKFLQDHQIGFIYELCDLQNLPLSSSDFCAIIMNLLDNATEASIKYHDETFEHFVKLIIRHHRDMYFIECTNPCPSRSLQKEHGYFISTKEGRGHGLGLKAVEKIADSIDGVCRFEQKGNYFKASVSLPYSESDSKDQ